MSQPTAEDLREIIGIDDAPYQAILDRYHLIDKTEPIPGATYPVSSKLPEPVSLHGMSVRDWSAKVYQFMQAVKRHLESGE